MAGGTNEPRTREAYIEPPPDEGPTAEDLAIPEEAIAEAIASSCLGFASKVEQHNLNLFAAFDNAFEHLVTRGDASGYPPMVDRFKPKFAALEQNLERIAARLDALKQVPLAGLVRRMATAAPDRLEKKLEEQVLRQQVSVSELESEERPALKERLKAVTASLKTKDAAVEEVLEELRAELADLDEE